jgi:hypothetical protein
VAPAQTKRQSRKRRKAGKPAAVVQRSEVSVSPPTLAERAERPRQSSLGTYGERPPSPFGGLPVSEVAIFVGALGALVGLITAGSAALIVGIVVCTLGVVEVTAREHFSGYRSHATLLAAVPAMGILVVSVALLGAPRQRGTRELLVAAAVPVFALLFWLLRKRFDRARQARVARPPTP